jgi:predicted glycosyltransferase
MTDIRVLFYVQHLLGIGHLRRAATLARAMSADGLAVTLVSGGHELPGLDLGGVDLIQLPATRATDLFFKVLVDENENVIDDDWRARRADQFLRIWTDFAPHILMFELFPFGRRQMRFEILPVLEAAKVADRRPVVVSSVRDILVAQSKPERNDQMLDLVETYFDHVLVHGDPNFVALDETFPHAARINDRVTYTGYVVDDSGMAKARSKADPVSDDAEVLVSAGGGAVGLNLLQTALAARPLSVARERPWRVLVGIKVDDSDFHRLAAAAGAPNVVVERARPDFPALLAGAGLSISQGGYNTVMEALAAGCRAVVVPYAGGVETEQTLRAKRLAERTPLEIIAEADLTPERLADAIDRALAAPPLAAGVVDMNGAATTVSLIRKWANEAGC